MKSRKKIWGSMFFSCLLIIGCNNSNLKETTMIEEQNKAIIQKAVEAFNTGDLSIADEIISPDYIIHGSNNTLRGPEAFRQMVTGTRNNFSDFNMKIDNIIADGDQVAAIITYTGTFTGEMMGTAPTGNKVKMTIAYFYRFADGKEIEATGFADNAKLFQQLGVNPPM